MSEYYRIAWKCINGTDYMSGNGSQLFDHETAFRICAEQNKLRPGFFHWPELVAVEAEQEAGE